MPAYTAILRSLSAEKFSEVLAAAPRQARETYFHRHSVKVTPKKTGLPKPGEKNALRAAALLDLLQGREDEEMCEEILRLWLLGKRPMLIAALDYLKIPHNDGLTDSDDLQKIEKLSTKELKSLVKALDGVAEKTDVALYLRFLGAQKVEEIL